jgi:hypothetical protein
MSDSKPLRDKALGDYKAFTASAVSKLFCGPDLTLPNGVGILLGKVLYYLPHPPRLASGGATVQFAKSPMVIAVVPCLDAYNSQRHRCK